MDFKETLFKRTLVKQYREGTDEDKWRMAEELTVTKEQNGYALWYQGGEVCQPAVIAWTLYGKDDLIAYAATLSVTMARNWAKKYEVNYAIPKLYDLALEPVPTED